MPSSPKIQPIWFFPKTIQDFVHNSCKQIRRVLQLLQLRIIKTTFTQLNCFNVQHNVNLIGRYFFFQLHFNPSCQTLVVTPQNVITLSTPKHTSFKAKLDFEKPPYKSKDSTITFVKLSTWEPSTTCYNVKRMGSHFHPSIMYTWVEMNTIDC